MFRPIVRPIIRPILGPRIIKKISNIGQFECKILCDKIYHSMISRAMMMLVELYFNKLKKKFRVINNRIY